MTSIKRQSPFHDEWKKCLEEHYKQVSATGNKTTMKTLHPLMGKLGFNERYLDQMHIEATMHVDHVEEGFMPDQDRINKIAAHQRHNLECACPSCTMNDPIVPHDDDGQPIVAS